MRPFPGAFAHTLRDVLLALTLAVMVPSFDRARAHEGHDNADKPAVEAGVFASPRVVAASDDYQFVGVVEGEVLVVYLDRAADNAPVTAATLEISLDGQPFKAELQKNGTYEVTAPLLRRPGQISVVVNIVDAAVPDLLAGALVIGQAAGQGTDVESSLMGPTVRWTVAGFGLALVTVVLIGFRASRRSAAIVVLGGLLSLVLAGGTFAHEGHDHGADIRASGGNSPQRRADGTIFLPKPSQRLLDVRTSILKLQYATRTVRLAGRVAASPNFSGVVQSTVPGRYEAPAGGVPPLGARVKAADLLGRIAPAFASIDASDMAQTMGDLEQRLSIARAKLARQEQLLRTNVVASALVDDDAHGGRRARQAPERSSGGERPRRGAARAR